MQKLCLESLPEDVIDRVLMYCTDFADLRALILSSRDVFSMFKSREKSILHAVSQNVAGPTLPYARELSLIRISLEDGAGSILEDLDSKERRDDFHQYLMEPRESKHILEIVYVGAFLENIFSMWFAENQVIRRNIV